MRTRNLEIRESDILQYIAFEREIRKLKKEIEIRQECLRNLRQRRKGTLENFKNFCYVTKCKSGLDIIGCIKSNLDKSDDEIMDIILNNSK